MSSTVVSQYTLYAREKLNRPDSHVGGIMSLTEEGFDGFRLDVFDVDDYKTKPGKNWRTSRNPQSLYVSAADYSAWLEAWETINDTCAKCEGSGHEWFSWSRIDGDKHRPCTKCDATGKPKARA